MKVKLPYLIRIDDFKFDSSVEIAMHLNLDTKKADQQLRGAVVLPNGTGKTKRILVLTKGDQANAAKEAFSEYLTNTNLDSRQIYFVNQIVEYIVHNGMLRDFSILQESPFTDQGSVVDIFTDLTVWFGIKKVIDTINDNAAA